MWTDQTRASRTRTYNRAAGTIAGATVVAAFLVAGALVGAAERRPAAAARYERPDPTVVRDAIRAILSDPQFSTKRRANPWVVLQRWLARRIGRFFRSAALAGGLGTVLLWFLTVWCALALLAILGHMIWSLLAAWHPWRTMVSRAGGWPGSPCAAERTFEELVAEMRKLAEQGRFDRAIGLMMGALLRRLSDLGLLTYDESKVNGEYVREYPRERAGRSSFRRFVLSFDTTIYGRGVCNRATYEAMGTLFDQIRSDVDKRPKV